MLNLCIQMRSLRVRDTLDRSGRGRASRTFRRRAAWHHGKRLLLICYLDTLLKEEQFRRDGQKAYGSGISDMKAGNLIAMEALRALHAAGALDNRQVILFFTGDEEYCGKPYEKSLAALVDAANRSDAALAFDGTLQGRRLPDDEGSVCGVLTCLGRGGTRPLSLARSGEVGQSLRPPGYSRHFTMRCANRISRSIQVLLPMA